MMDMPVATYIALSIYLLLHFFYATCHQVSRHSALYVKQRRRELNKLIRKELDIKYEIINSKINKPTTKFQRDKVKRSF